MRAIDEEGNEIARLRIPIFRKEYPFTRPDGSTCKDVVIINRAFHWDIRIGQEIHRAVLKLVGEHRKFGNDTLGLVHRDFASEAEFHCRDDLVGPAVILGFMIWNGLQKGSSSNL